MTCFCWACGAEVGEDVTDEAGYVSCQSCGLRFYAAGVGPRAAYGEQYFERYRGGNYFETEAVRRHEARVRLAMVRAEVDRPGDLLEVGSAAGFFLHEAQRQGWRPVGVEPAPEAARFAHERLAQDVRVGFAEDVELGEGLFDAGCLWHTLEHVPCPHRLLESLLRALRPGAPLLLEVPNGGSLQATRDGARWFALEPDVHVAQWSPGPLRVALGRAGFTDVRTSTVPFLTYVPGILARFPRRVKLAVRQRRWLVEPHPEGHELLRAVGRRPQ